MQLIISNEFIRAINSIKGLNTIKNLSEEKMLLSLLSNVRYEDELDKIYTKTENKLNTDIGLTNSRNTSLFKKEKKLIESYASKGVVINKYKDLLEGEKKGPKFIEIFQTFGFNVDNNKFWFKISPEFKKKHLNLDKAQLPNFTVIELQHIGKIKSIYMLRFYLYLLSWQNLKGGILRTDIRNLYDILGYKGGYNSLKEKVLTPSEKCFQNMSINFEVLKVKRKNNYLRTPVEEIIIKIIKNNLYKPQLIKEEEKSELTNIINEFITNNFLSETATVDNKCAETMLNSCDNDLTLILATLLQVSVSDDVRNFLEYFFGIIREAKKDKTGNGINSILDKYKSFIKTSKQQTFGTEQAITEFKIEKKEEESQLIQDNLEEISDFAQLMLSQVEQLGSNLTFEDINRIIKDEINKSNIFNKSSRRLIEDTILAKAFP